MLGSLGLGGVMRHLWAALLLLGAGSARAMSVSCKVDVDVDTRITRLAIDQEVGAERLECVQAPASGELHVHVVRIVKTEARAEARSSAKASASADASYSDSCSCSGCSGSCHTSGSGWDSCSDSGDDAASSRDERATTFTVARVPAQALPARGYWVEGGPGACRINDAGGNPVDLLRSIALVTWLYGEELLEKGGADMVALRRSLSPVSIRLQAKPARDEAGAPAFDDSRRKP